MTVQNQKPDMWQLSDRLIYIIPFFLVMQYQFVSGQDIPVYNQYFSDYSLICDALTGKDNCYSIDITDMHQWLGINGAPNTQAIHLTGQFASSEKHTTSYHGLGIMLARDINGPYSALRFSGTYSFHILLSENRKLHLSFAISPSCTQNILDQGNFYNLNNDPVITGRQITAWNPNAGISAAIYNSVYFAGAGVTGLFSPASYLSDPVETDLNRRQYMFIAGYRFYNLQHNLILEPSAVFRMNEIIFKQADLNLKVFYKDFLWSGLSYRHNLDIAPGSTSDILPAIGIFIKNLQISYAFDISFRNLENRSNGSHYIYLAWKLCKAGKGSLPCPVFK